VLIRGTLTILLAETATFGRVVSFAKLTLNRRAKKRRMSFGWVTVGEEPVLHSSILCAGLPAAQNLYTKQIQLRTCQFRQDFNTLKNSPADSLEAAEV